MDENKLPPLWYTPWRWNRDQKITVLIIWLPLYVASFMAACAWAGNSESEWPRAVVKIVYAPLIFGIRIFYDARS